LRVFGTVVVTIVGLFGALVSAAWFGLDCILTAVDGGPPKSCGALPVIAPIAVLAFAGVFIWAIWQDRPPPDTDGQDNFRWYRAE
jgi:hypothetical protein